MKYKFLLFIFCLSESLLGQNPISQNFNYDKLDQEVNPKSTLPSFTFEMNLSVDLLFKDFSQFKNNLPSYDIDFLDRSNGTAFWGMGGSYRNKIYSTLNLGSYDDFNKYKDSLNLSLHSFDLYLNLGYKLVDSRRISFIPLIAFKWYRYKLINSDLKRKIPLAQYLNNRDIDLRINQTILFIGFNLDIKLYGPAPFGGKNNYWTFGFYSGYPLKINSVPWIYSSGNRLTTDKQIKIEPINVGVRLSFCIFN